MVYRFRGENLKTTSALTRSVFTAIASPRGIMFSLISKDARFNNAGYTLKIGSNTTGRSSENDWCIDDASVSGSHCEILVHGERVFVKDLGSTNGTYINQIKVVEQEMFAEEILRIGNVDWELIHEETEPETKADMQTIEVARM